MAEGVANNDMGGVEIAEGGLGAGWAAECGDGGCEPLGSEALPGLLALPDVDDAKALIGGPSDVQDQPVGWRLDGRSRHPLVLLPGGRDILDEGVRHSRDPLLPSVCPATDILPGGSGCCLGRPHSWRRIRRTGGSASRGIRSSCVLASFGPMSGASLNEPISSIKAPYSLSDKTTTAGRRTSSGAQAE